MGELLNLIYTRKSTSYTFKDGNFACRWILSNSPDAKNLLSKMSGQQLWSTWQLASP